MFKLNEKYDVNIDFLKCDYIRYSPSEISTINTLNSGVYINSPRGDSVNSLLGSLLSLIFDALQTTTNNRYVNGNDIRLVNKGPIALFSNYKLASSSGKHIEEIHHAQTVCLMYKLITSSRNSDDFPIGFDRDRERRKRDLTNNKNMKGKNHVTIMLQDTFGFAEHQQKGLYGLGYQWTLTGNSDNAVLNKGNATNDAKIIINNIDWYVPNYTPSIKQQGILVE